MNGLTELNDSATEEVKLKERDRKVGIKKKNDD